MADDEEIRRIAREAAQEVVRSERPRSIAGAAAEARRLMRAGYEAAARAGEEGGEDE